MLSWDRLAHVVHQPDPDPDGRLRIRLITNTTEETVQTANMEDNKSAPAGGLAGVDWDGSVTADQQARTVLTQLIQEIPEQLRSIRNTLPILDAGDTDLRVLVASGVPFAKCGCGAVISFSDADLVAETLTEHPCPDLGGSGSEPDEPGPTARTILAWWFGWWLVSTTVLLFILAYNGKGPWS